GKTAEFALLLGTRPVPARERALAAARLYHSGRVRYVIPSGGVEWDVNGRPMTEACYMAQILQEEGVPSEAIVLENEATTTKENMIYGALQMNRKTKFKTGKGVILVTSQNHMKRSLALAKTFLPRMTEISACPADSSLPKEELLQSEEFVKALEKGLLLLKGLVDCGIIEDMELLSENDS
ncbi:MAG: YdcF family protein, partial [Clostridia bacterium]|nr:YdcF family protein [Clostridia bacterium]